MKDIYIYSPHYGYWTWEDGEEWVGSSGSYIRISDKEYKSLVQMRDDNHKYQRLLSDLKGNNRGE